MVGRGVLLSVFSSFPGGLPVWGRLSKIGLGLGCPALLDVRWDLSGALFQVSL